MIRRSFRARVSGNVRTPASPTPCSGVLSRSPALRSRPWFPLATEITARFNDSQNHFTDNNTYVCMLAWLPEHIIYGKPYILDVVAVSGATVAHARDTHYHNPPDYLVLEPEDTTERTRNLQQTNTNGYKLQTTDHAELAEASRIVQSWGSGGATYRSTPEYRQRLRELLNRFNYRLDTNYAKMDRIVHAELEAFKSRVMAREVKGLTVREWERLFRSKDDARIGRVLKERLGITKGDVDELLE